MFTTTLTPTEKPFQSVSWSFNFSKPIIVINSQETIGPEYKGRITFFPSTASLELRSLTLDDTGPYSVSIMHDGIIPSEKISGSSVKPSTNLTVEGTSVSLTCEASGSVFTRNWMKDGSDLTPTDNMTLSDNNRVLTFHTVKRKDEGEYFCNISNPVSNGPENVQIKGPDKIIIKGALKLTCSAESAPTARFTWFLNGTKILTNSVEYIKEGVELSDSGNYICQAWNNITERTSSSVVHGLTVTASRKTSTTNLVEFNDTAVLMCRVSKGTSLSYQWFNGSSMITTKEKVQLSSGNTILTIMNVTRYDQGLYKCNVSNNVSNDISAPVNLTVSYGPSNTEMTVMPLMNIYKGGSNITLSCSAVSSPPAMFQWMVNGVYLNKIEPKLELEKVNESMSGNYTCLIHNNVTFRFNPVTAVVVSLAKPAIFGETFSLSCEVTGPVDIIHWWRNDQLISADNKTTFDTGNRTLTISSTQHSDGGDYQCEAFNSVSNQTSHRFTVTVYYGPEKPIIYGPAFAETGRQAVFSCSAMSVPLTQFCWWFNGSMVSNTSVYATSLLSFNMSGEYTCMAINNVTGKNSTNSTTTSSEKSAQYSFELCAKKTLFIILQYIIQTKSFFFQMAQSD
uniref:Ig-like domain-containing protein n=1 Tax=Neolamprologus brichardi TaxID=32507 RepID=A0A3Q4HR15_NEOBR